MSRSASTRARILTAAVEEFAEHGFAGSRVDRIAERAGANKRMIYVYFGDKETLFAETLRDSIRAMIESVPVTGHDLADYAQRLFDYLLAHPEALRLSLWRHLERPDVGPEVRALYTAKIDAVRQVVPPPRGGVPPVDLLVLVQGMASAWLISPLDLLTLDSAEPLAPARLAAHRAALGDAVRALTTPRET